VIQSYMPRVTPHPVFEIKFDAQRLQKTRVEVRSFPRTDVLFLPMGKGADGASAGLLSRTLPSLCNEPAAVWLAFQKQEEPIASSSSAHRPPLPPLDPLSAHDEGLVREARSKHGLVREWEDNVPLTAATFARLSCVPSDAVVGDERYHLDDEAVNAFVGMLNRECMGSYGFVFNSHVYTALSNADRKLSEEIMKRLLKSVPSYVDLLSQEQLLFVVNKPATASTAGHWFFVRAQQRHAYIAAVDSCTGTHSDAISLVQSFIEHLHAQNACKRGLTVQTQRTEDWRSASLQPPVTPRQPDAVSCGIYMLIGLWCCMSGAQLSQCLDSKPVNYWRNVITLCLYRGGLGAFALPALP